jgi:hypothetical protein
MAAWRKSDGVRKGGKYNEQKRAGNPPLYRAAEIEDSKKFASLFTEDGVFNDVSVGVKYRGKELGRRVDIYAAACTRIQS